MQIEIFPNWERSGRQEVAHWLPSGRRDSDDANVLFLRHSGPFECGTSRILACLNGAFLPVWRENQLPGLRLDLLPRPRRRFLRGLPVWAGSPPLRSAGVWGWDCVGSGVSGVASAVVWGSGEA